MSRTKVAKTKEATAREAEIQILNNTLKKNEHLSQILPELKCFLLVK